MTDAVGQRQFTKAIMDDVLRSMAKPVEPSVILISSYSKAVFATCDIAEREKWNWRRTKRELRRIGLRRRGVRREYHKRAA